MTDTTAADDNPPTMDTPRLAIDTDVSQYPDGAVDHLASLIADWLDGIDGEINTDDALRLAGHVITVADEHRIPDPDRLDFAMAAYTVVLHDRINQDLDNVERALSRVFDS